MFDFLNYTYSGILSILSTLFGLSYPLVIGCIGRIEDKYGSTNLSERFMSETIFIWFKRCLVINLVMAVLFPFLMDMCTHARIIIGLQCVGAIVLVSCALLLFSKIITYYKINDLQKEVLEDYNKVVEKNEKKKAKAEEDEKAKAEEKKYFTQWVDVLVELLKYADNKIVQSVYDVLSNYVKRVDEENMRKKGKALEFDLYYYEGISRINEVLSKGESKPISLTDANSILTTLILTNSVVSKNTYRYLWRNLRIQMSYNKDKWIMGYWEIASLKIGHYMKPIYQYLYNEKEEPYTKEQIENIKKQNEDNQKQREIFMEFHIMLCSMLLQEKKYGLLGLMLSYTSSEPPTYPLVPSNLSEIIATFNRINRNSFNDPFYYESRYQMPNMHGITEEQIVGAANRYLALLAYRIYVIRWNYGYKSVLNTGALPNTLTLPELNTLKENLNVFKWWLEQIKDNKELLHVVNISSFDKEIEEKKQFYCQTDILRPEELVSQMQDEISAQMDRLKTTSPLSEEIVNSLEDELNSKIVKAMTPYGDLLDISDERILPSQDCCHDLDSSLTIPFPSTAFMNNPDVVHIGTTDCMSDQMLHNFQRMFAGAFFEEHNVSEYRLSSEDLFPAIEKLNLDDTHYIIAFGIYFDQYIGSVEDLKEETDHNYLYKGIKILSLECISRDFSQMVYVMRFADRPYLNFQDPSEDKQKKFCLRKKENEYGLWLSINKISEHPELLEEPIKTKLGDKADQNSLFTAIWEPKLYFKPNNPMKYPIVSIKIEYPFINEGKYDNVDKVKPFPRISNQQ